MKKTSSSSNENHSLLKKVPTFISELDDILEGGLPKNRTTVIKGQSGSGKSVFGLQFLYNGALNDEPGIFVGFEETANQIRENAATLGMDFQKLEKQNKLFIIEGQLPTDAILHGNFSLKGLLGIIAGTSKKIGAKRIVIDALDVTLRLFEHLHEVRAEMHLLNNFLRESGLTVVMSIRLSRTTVSAFEDFFDSLCDCVINLDVRIHEQISTRRLRVVKYRGSNFSKNEYPYVITSKGIEVTPISSFGLRHKPLGEHITTGNSELDKILGGGYRRASCVLIAGLPGVGKTILASTFVNATCARGEKVLYVGFEESEQALIGNVKSAGILLEQFTKNNKLVFMNKFPEEIGAEEHFILLKRKVKDFKPRHIIIDAISATVRMGEHQASYEYLMRTLNLAKEMGITTLFLNQLTGQTTLKEISGINISSMVDTAIFLSYVEYLGETNRIIDILKSRGSKHTNQKREYIITDNGIEIQSPYIGSNQVFTGSARLIQEKKDAIELKLAEFRYREKELEVERLKFELKKYNLNFNTWSKNNGENAQNKNSSNENNLQKD